MPEKNKTYTIKITETAWEMLIAHARFLVNVSVSAANGLIDAFVETTDSLTSMPERNSWLENKAFPFQKYRKILFGKHFMALYEIQGNIVYINAVVDCRQDYGWLL
jgi:plasmid stabilization system protein ParE